MAKPVTYNASKIYIQLGDGATPTEIFTEPCGLTTRGINFSKETNDVSVPDCDDPDLPTWIERGVTSFSMEATGSGVLAAEARPAWWDAFNQTESINAKIGINAPPTDEGGHWAGKVHVTTFNVTGELGNKAQVAISVLSDGEMNWVDSTSLLAVSRRSDSERVAHER